MPLSQDLIQQFAKLSNEKPKQKTEKTVKGTYKTINGEEFVQIDGSDIWTPVTSTVEAETGERVTVLIKDHSATVTGNITSPSARNKTVENLKNEVDEHGNTIKQLDNSITQQANSIIQIENNIKQVDNTINQFNNTIDQQNNKIQQFDNIIKEHGDNITSMNNAITSQGNQIESMNNTIEQQNNTINQQGNVIQQQGNTISQQGNTISQQGTKMESFDSSIKILNSAFTINDNVLEGLSKIVVDDLKTKTLNAEYANIDFANIKMAAVEKLFADSGIIKDLIVSEGRITGELVGVTIKGDLIEGNTVKADKLVVKGSDGLYYKLNLDALGEATVSADEKYQNGLDGSVIIAKSIVAEKIAVDDLVAFGATIGGFKITDHSIYSGVKESVNNTTRGIYIDDSGQLAFGDNNNFVKYFKDEDGNYKISIKANAISIGAGGKDLEESMNDLSKRVDEVDAIQIGGRNLYLGTKHFTGNHWFGLENWELLDEEYNGFSIYKRTGAWLGIYQELDVVKGENYIFSFYLKGDGNAKPIVYTVPSNADKILNPYNVDMGNVTEEFVKYVFKFEAVASGTVGFRVENSIEDSWIQVCGFKVEKGNKETDWSPAPEDTDDAVTDAKNDAINSATDIANNTENRINEKLNDYVTNDTFNEYKESTSTQFDQTNKDFTFLFNHAMDQITEVDGKTQTEFQRWQEYIRFVDGNIVLGKTGNEITLHLENDVLYFLQNNARVAYLSNNKLYVTDSEILNSLKIGKFAFTPRANGSLSFGKVGE